MTGPLDELDALLAQMKRDHAVGATLPNRAGTQVKAAGERIQGYADVLEGALRHLRQGHVTSEEDSVQAHPDPASDVTLIGALAPSPVAARPEGTLRAALEALAAEWEGGADLDPALDDLGDLAQAGARRGCARQLRALLRGADGGTP